MKKPQTEELMAWKRLVENLVEPLNRYWSVEYLVEGQSNLYSHNRMEFISKEKAIVP